MQLKVVKADGSVEGYIHTKVLGTVNNALALSGESNIFAAEQLADAVTYFLYERAGQPQVTTSEIFSMVQVVLASTSYEEAAAALAEHRYRRRILRERIEVTEIASEDGLDAVFRNGMDLRGASSRWDKSKIVNHLCGRYGLHRQVARTIASMVEEKILSMGVTRVTPGLIAQLVLCDTVTMLQAEQKLQTADARCEKSHADTDVCLRQQQKGLCPVGP